MHRTPKEFNVILVCRESIEDVVNSFERKEVVVGHV
jgi:hypothetical protein